MSHLATTNRPRPRQRRYLPPDELRPLFVEIGRYRALTVPHAHALVFSRIGSTTRRSVERRVKTLLENGYLAAFTVPERPPVRFLYLTRPAFRHWPDLGAHVPDVARRKPPIDLALYAWTRAALRASAEAAGYTVGRDVAALTALRRSLIDRQQRRLEEAPTSAKDDLSRVLTALRRLPLLQPWTVGVCDGCGLELAPGAPSPPYCEECGGTFTRTVVRTPFRCSRCDVLAERPGYHTTSRGVPCPGVLRAVDYLPFDLAWRRTSAGYDVQLLLADNPYRSLAAQLEELPLRVIGQPPIDVVLRPSDDGSVWDRDNGTYAVRGPRFRALLRAFSATRARPEAFPLWTTATVLPDSHYPDTHFRVLT